MFPPALGQLLFCQCILTVILLPIPLSLHSALKGWSLPTLKPVSLLCLSIHYAISTVLHSALAQEVIVDFRWAWNQPHTSIHINRAAVQHGHYFKFPCIHISEDLTRSLNSSGLITFLVKKAPLFSEKTPVIWYSCELLPLYHWEDLQQSLSVVRQLHCFRP